MQVFAFLHSSTVVLSDSLPLNDPERGWEFQEKLGGKTHKDPYFPASFPWMNAVI